MIKENEIIERLEKVDKRIIQKKGGFRFSIDPVLLANFIKIPKKIKIADLGTGSAIMPLLLANNEMIKKIYAFEIQEEIAEMAKRTIELNKLGKKIVIYNKDINEIDSSKYEVDMIITNPPYMKVEEGKVSEDLQKAISRHELKLKLAELIKKSAEILNKKGSFNIIYRTERLEELLEILRKNKLYVKRIRFIYSKIGKTAKLFMLEAQKEIKNILQIEEALYLYNQNNNYTSEVLKYYE
ncbi:MAG: hypothetical protein B6I28_03395 [Fusobacteriia bacterium 4572_132]|nr:MAG: hypothetical protein B6I28_03395 [Fusobacteriia bacterium 4572_132]